MSTSVHSNSGQSPYVKVANYPGLYRHAVTGNYCAQKKFKDKRKERSLRTTDRQIAERRFKEWVRQMSKIDSEVEKTELRELIQKYIDINQGKSESTQATNASIIKTFKQSWKHGLAIQVRHIRTTELEEWLASQEKRLANSSYNRYAGFLKELFEIAVKDRIIDESPFKHVKTSWKKPQEVRRLIPTAEEFQAIVKVIPWSAQEHKGVQDHGRQESTEYCLSEAGIAPLHPAQSTTIRYWHLVEVGHRQETDCQVARAPRRRSIDHGHLYRGLWVR